MGESHALMQSMLVSVGVLLAVPALVAGAAVVWYVRTRHHARHPGQG